MRKKRFLLMILAAALVALPALAQTFGANQAEQPNAAFQSTSTMTGSGSQYSSNPMLNADGTATYGEQQQVSAPKGLSSKPRRGGREPSDDGFIPVGDAVLPLLLCAFAFCAVTYLRRKKALKS